MTSLPLAIDVGSSETDGACAAYIAKEVQAGEYGWKKIRFRDWPSKANQERLYADGWIVWETERLADGHVYFVYIRKEQRDKFN